ncbi:MAG: hypothetical protein AAGA48_09060 [Myxococcota bacterium]
MTGLRRDGHLSDLAIEYALDGEPLEGTTEHLEHCDMCSARLRAAGGVVVPPRRVRRPPRWWYAAAPLAMAATALLVLSSSPDGIRVKGGGVELQVFRDEGPKSRRLAPGDEVAPGDRLGFRVRVREEGHIMVVGTDGQQPPYLSYPQDAEASVPFAATDHAVDLDSAIRLDDALGTERLVLLWCETSFELDVAERVAMDDTVPPGCMVDVVELEKR